MLASIWKPSERRRGSDSQQRALIYFVCGNPGLIGFYVDFLDALRNLLDTWHGHAAYDLYGRNLAGFSDHDHEPFGPHNPPLDIDAQVTAMYHDVASRRTSSGKPYDFVILMGHSIGAYICVEIFHRHMHSTHPHPSPPLHLRHGFLLFPTIASLGLSAAGTRFNSLRRLPTMETHMASYAQALLRLFPQSTQRWILAYVMGFSHRTANLTAQWLKSRDGILQALHMAKSELDTIHEDKWDDELWEAASGALPDTHLSSADSPSSPSSSSSSHPSSPATVIAAPSSAPPPAPPPAPQPRFFMFYGREDHWVANHVRDEFIERRGRGGEKGGAGTWIAVDEGSIPHAFCVGEDTSWMIARKVHAWVTQTDDAAARAA
ncbi:hypothetical protein E4U55_006200 [Claviceps digitariae]|nr:hypothetical protein E4U55_006200 [Claviceps digitariae]